MPVMWPATAKERFHRQIEIHSLLHALLIFKINHIVSVSKEMNNFNEFNTLVTLRQGNYQVTKWHLLLILN